jgi:hypothetical protein
MRTWIIPVKTHDGRSLFVSVKAWTKMGAMLAFWSREPADDTPEDTALHDSAVPIGPPVVAVDWIKHQQTVSRAPRTE